MDIYADLAEELTKKGAVRSEVDHTGGGCMANRFYVKKPGVPFGSMKEVTPKCFILTNLDRPWAISVFHTEKDWTEGDGNNAEVFIEEFMSGEAPVAVVAAAAVEWAKIQEGM